MQVRDPCLRPCTKGLSIPVHQLMSSSWRHTSIAKAPRVWLRIHTKNTTPNHTVPPSRCYDRSAYSSATQMHSRSRILAWYIDFKAWGILKPGFDNCGAYKHAVKILRHQQGWYYVQQSRILDIRTGKEVKIKPKLRCDTKRGTPKFSIKGRWRIKKAQAHILSCHLNSVCNMSQPFLSNRINSHC